MNAVTTTDTPTIPTEQLDEAVRPLHLADLILEGCQDTEQHFGDEGNSLRTCARGAAIHALVKRGWLR